MARIEPKDAGRGQQIESSRFQHDDGRIVLEHLASRETNRVKGLAVVLHAVAAIMAKEA